MKIEKIHIRISALFAIFFLAMAYIGFKLWKIMTSTPMIVFDQDHTARPTIFDRNGNIIAVSMPIRSLYASPRNIEDPEKAAKALCKIFPDLNYQKLLEKLSSGKVFIWLKNNISKEEEIEVKKLKLAYIDVRSDLARIYPHGSLFSHVIGAVNINQKGIMGLERWIDTQESNDAEIHSSLDLNAQFILREEIEKGIEEFDAEWGCGMIVEISTGEVIALVSLPYFDPHHIISPDDPSMFNHAVSGIYEFGSIFKIFNLALCIEHGNTTKKYDISSPLKIASFTVKDVKPRNESINIFDGFLLSSNICNAKAALDIGAEKQQEFLYKIGLLDAPMIELCEIGRPSIPRSWGNTTVVTVSYGYGISVTALHVAQACLNIINAKKIPLTLIKGKKHTTEEINITKEISLAIVDTMRKNNEKWHNARISDYSFGGKTGTTNMIASGRYVEKKNITSFIGIFPAKNPQYLIVIILGAPKPSKKTFGFATSVWFTVPIARNIINILMDSGFAKNVDEA